MKMYLIILLLICSCSLKKGAENDCSAMRLLDHRISAPFNAHIDLPDELKIIDSSTIGVDKHLISSQILYSKDSSSKAFILVQDFGRASEFEKDTTKIKNYLKQEIREMKNNNDSILDIKGTKNNGWTTVSQKSCVKVSKSILVGQIFSGNNGKEISIVVEIPAADFEKATKIMGCILSSYSVGQ
jgi:hypothetical protein